MVNQSNVSNDKNKKVKVVLIFGGILLGIILVGILSKVLWSNVQHMSHSEQHFSGNTDAEISPFQEDGYIALIPINGVITSSVDNSLLASSPSYNHQGVLGTIDELMYDEDNLGLIFFVDSPGGGVYESDELYFKILEYQEVTGRPVYSSMGSMAASGGYYISAPADKIIANRNCWTGSIGVTIGTLYDVTGLLEKYGIKAVHIDSGKNKAMGSMTQELTKEQKEIFQSLVDESYEQFVDVVAQGRDMDKEELLPLADGRIYTAKQAKENGLIDEIGTLDDAIFMMQEDQSWGDCEVRLYQTQPELLDSLLAKVLGARQPSGDVKALLDLMSEQGEFPISYMYQM